MHKIIKLIRRSPKLKKQRNRLAVYDICLIKKSSHRKFVYEKLGTYSLKNNYFNINIFRLAFWMSKNISLTGNTIKLLTNHNIFRFFMIKEKKWQ